MRSRVHYTLQWACEGLAALNTRVIPSKLMKRGSKYPLKHQEGGEGSPSKDSKKGSPDGLEKKKEKKKLHGLSAQ